MTRRIQCPLLPGFFLLLLVSCGEFGASGGQLAVDREHSGPRPYRLPARELDCPGGGARARILSGEFVKHATFGAYWRRQCKDATCRGPGGTQPFAEVRRGQILNLCSDPRDYDSGTYESVGAIGFNALELLAKKVRGLLPNLPLHPIELSIFPEFESIILGSPSEDSQALTRDWRVDTLAYQPEIKTIAVYPKSDRADPATPLWESQFVWAHEFAHHLSHAVTDTNNPQDLTGRLSSTDVGNSLLASRDELIIDGYREGIADLMAFYLTGPDNMGLDNLSCYRVDRNVLVEYFDDGTPKIFADSSIRQASKLPTPRKDLCSPLTPGSPYRLGAIFAHLANKLFQMGNRLAGGTHTLAPSEGLVLAVAWLKGVHEPYSARQDLAAESQLLAHILAKLVATATDHNYAQSENSPRPDELCRQVRDSFPTVPTC